MNSWRNLYEWMKVWKFSWKSNWNLWNIPGSKNCGNHGRIIQTMPEGNTGIISRIFFALILVGITRSRSFGVLEDFLEQNLKTKPLSIHWSTATNTNFLIILQRIRLDISLWIIILKLQQDILVTSRHILLLVLLNAFYKLFFQDFFSKLFHIFA